MLSRSKIVQMLSIGIIHIWVESIVGSILRDPFKLKFIEGIQNRVHSTD